MRDSAKTTTPDVVACMRPATSPFASVSGTGRGVRDSVKTKIKMMGRSAFVTPEFVCGLKRAAGGV